MGSQMFFEGRESVREPHKKAQDVQEAKKEDPPPEEDVKMDPQ
jgi:hypothetical protein